MSAPNINHFTIHVVQAVEVALGQMMLLANYCALVLMESQPSKGQDLKFQHNYIKKLFPS
jgi:hypothetical protein